MSGILTRRIAPERSVNAAKHTPHVSLQALTGAIAEG